VPGRNKVLSHGIDGNFLAANSYAISVKQGRRALREIDSASVILALLIAR
jgi:hypothetical protein